jgi:iron complex transport system substrate-binding protein
MFRSIQRAVGCAAVLVLGLAACGGGEDPVAEAGAETSAPVSTAGEPSGSEPSVSEPPATEPASPNAPALDLRIVSLSPSATEMIFAIGAGDLVVAVDDQSNFPEAALAVQTDLSGYTPNIEAIAAYEPDLVLHDGTTDLGAQLDGIGIDDWVGAAPTSFDDIYVQIEELGAATGRSAEATALVTDMRAEIEAAVAAAERDVPLRYYHELDPTLFTVTSNTFIGQVYGLFGLQNIADTTEGTTDYPQLSAEFLVSQSPHLIFLADTKCCGESAESVAARPGWETITAVVDGNIIAIDDDIASRWGPRIVEFVAAVSDAVAATAGS